METKVCGACNAAELAALSEAGATHVGMVFINGHQRHVGMSPSLSGLMPDTACGNLGNSTTGVNRPVRVGVFADEMAQNVIARIYNYDIGMVQFDGNEPPTYIENLRRTIVPDIRTSLLVCKTIRVSGISDLAICTRYADCVDYFQFNFTMQESGEDGIQSILQTLDSYAGNVPYWVGGDLSAAAARAIMSADRKLCHGIDLSALCISDADGCKTDALHEFANLSRKCQATNAF